MSGPVAVLGAGIMGSSAALHLARLGRDVVLFDEATEAFTGASRWNEGKIHLGFLYAADPTLATARAVLPGGLEFRDQVTRLTGIDVEAATATADDHYLVHRDSVVGAEATGAYFDAVAGLVASTPGADRYLVDVSSCAVERLDPRALAEVADPGVVVAGFRVPERSVDTRQVADGFVAALAAEDRIDAAFGTRVEGVEQAGDAWFVRTAAGRSGPYAAVVNALWHGRPAVDRTVGHHPDVDPQHRYRVSLFVQTDRPVAGPCTVLSVGPFGDVKNYDGRNFYLSWYPLGLLAGADGDEPPVVPPLDDHGRAELAAGVFDALASALPFVRDVQAAAETVRVEGGWVYSQGRGRLDDPAATVHRRHRLGISEVGTYFSVDTGKYSVAPTLGQTVAEAVVAAT